jgi:TetR/AcrR family transcriptional repressor of nem operon
MPPTTDTRQRLIDAAAELFWERGYAATGLSDILESAGARGGSLYHFFPTKDDLLLAVIDHHARVLETTIENTLAAHEGAREKTLAFVEFYRRFMERTGFSLGCPLTNLGAEVADTHPTAATRIASFNARIVQRLSACVAACDGRPDDAEPTSIAMCILAMVQGAALQARACKNAAPLTACAEAVARMLGFRPVVNVITARSAAFAES